MTGTETALRIPADAGPIDDSDGLALVVGIGSSAGGLEALTSLVAHLPLASGICCVVAQHMSPQHKSMMVELLSRATRIPVQEAVEGTRLQPDRIFITPPNRNIQIRGQKVVLTDPFAEGPKPSVDLLFESLAQDLGRRVAGIILSGTGSDGARGIGSIKHSGGFTLVQSPETAKYSGMPDAALRTGVIDKTTTPDRMGRALAEYARAMGASNGISDHEVRLSGDQDLGEDAPSTAFDAILALIRQHTNIDFKQYKPATLLRRIQRRMAANRARTIEDYIDLLLTQPQEVQRLSSDILISVTSFFRDKEAFDALGLAIDQILDQKPARQSIRIWVPGCATGEEAYSVGMVLMERLLLRDERRQFQIFAVDIDEAALAIARRATYPATAIENLAPELVQKYLNETGNVYQVDRQLRDMVVFSRQDITRDAPFSHIDLISCRNVLIYFNNSLQDRVIKLFAYALNPNGLLFLGKTETLSGEAAKLFRPINNLHRIFFRVEGARVPLGQIGGRLQETLAQRTPQRQRSEPPALPVMVRMTLGDLFGPPSVVIDGNQRVVYIQGDVSPYLRLGEGAFDQDLMTLIVSSIRTTLRALLHRAERSENERISLPVRMVEGDQCGELRITVNPMGMASGTGPGPLKLITFEPVTRTVSDPHVPQGIGPDTSAEDPRLSALEHELNVTREHLQTVIEELEAANEELQAANEEMQSSNEELQATNEELETTNEELQSTNEELQTVNDELQAKSNELLEKATDLLNIGSSINAPLVVVDRELRVRFFNDGARELFGVTYEDMGAPLTQMVIYADLSDLRRKIQSVIETGVMYEEDITARRGEIFSINLMPYRDADQRIVGAIFIANNVTDRVRAENNLRELTRQLNEAQRIAHIGSWRWDIDEDSFSWSPELYRICGLDPDEFTPGFETAINIYHPDDRDTVRSALETAMRDKTGFGFEARIVRPGGDVRHVRVTGLCKLNPSGHAEAMFGVTKDITESISAAQLLAESHARLTTIMNTIIEGIIVIDTAGTIRLANTAVTQMFNYTESELVGKNVSVLMPDPAFRHHDEYVRNYLRTGQHRIIGIGREVIGRRKDGTLFPLELSIGEVVDETASGVKTNRHMFIGTLHDVTARKRYEEALMLAKRDAESASEAKSMFLAKMSHELRTPLNAILGFSEILKEQLFGPLHNEKYLRYLEDIHSSGQHLLKLIDDILDISRIESGKFRIDEEIFELGPMLTRCLDQVRALSERKSIVLLKRLPDQLPRLRADSRSVRQILLNLLSNAIKFTPARGTVTLGVMIRPGGALAISVSDTGPGMTQAEMAQAFQPFGQGPVERPKNSQGPGLGLFIARSLAELHGGRLEIESELKKGTQAVVCFPENRVVGL